MFSVPPFIEKLINDELPEDYEYDYFKENPEENILYRNICYNYDELYSLISNALKLKEEISINKNVLSKFELYKKTLDKLKKKINDEETNKFVEINLKQEIKCFLLSDFINNEKLKKY